MTKPADIPEDEPEVEGFGTINTTRSNTFKTGVLDLSHLALDPVPAETAAETALKEQGIK